MNRLIVIVLLCAVSALAAPSDNTKIVQIGDLNIEFNLNFENSLKDEEPHWIVVNNMLTPEKMADAEANDIDGRIIGGSQASLGQFPYQVGLLLSMASGTSFCGGSLISGTWTLTAAHCTQGVRSVSVRMGGLTMASAHALDAIRAINHNSYNPSNLNNDVALLNIPSIPSNNANIRPIALASSDPSVGASGVVSGWGRTSNSGGVSNNLMWTSTNIISNAVCSQTYNVIVASTICATQATCNGDSGGPLTVGGQQVGIVSFGSSAGCTSGRPNGYGRVTSFRNWIRTNSGV